MGNISLFYDNNVYDIIGKQTLDFLSEKVFLVNMVLIHGILLLQRY